MQALTPSEVLGAATQQLLDSGFSSAQEVALQTDDLLRVFEDSLSIVGVVHFETWEELSARWPEAQAALVELLSERLEPNDPKAWEGYLLLFTVDIPPSAAAVDVIRRDTTRLRKIVTTGNELHTLGQIEQALLPVTPLRATGDSNIQTGVLGRMPDLLASNGGPPAELTSAAVNAFEANTPIMEAIWAWRRAQ